MKILKWSTICLALVAMTMSCNPQKQVAGYYNYETECLGVEMDGSQTVKAWGKGANKMDAVEQAKKNAVRDVLFKGIRNGKSECNQRPVLGAVNVQENNENYFNKFFADGGEFTKYVNYKDQSNNQPTVSRNRKGAGEEVAYGVIVRVLRAELKQKMMTDKILSE